MFRPISTTLIDRQIIAEQTLEISLERPDDFDFRAGQHINIKLTELLFEDKKAGRRTLTIASAPAEDKLILATRNTGSGFKETLAKGPLQSVQLIGPSGHFLRDETRPAVFLAGGMGITPFRSLVLDAVNSGINQPITLFYSNRSIDTAAYHELFVRTAIEHPTIFTYVPTITGETNSWNGERRRIDIDFIKKHISDLTAVTFYVCGPPGMVTGMIDILKENGVDQERILSESFWGY